MGYARGEATARVGGVVGGAWDGGKGCRSRWRFDRGSCSRIWPTR